MLNDKSKETIVKYLYKKSTVRISNNVKIFITQNNSWLC